MNITSMWNCYFANVWIRSVQWLLYLTARLRHTIVTVYPKKYAHGFCFAVLCCGYTLTDFPISIRLTSLALWQSNDCPSASKATVMNMDKYFMWIHYERLHNHNKAKHNKTVCIFLGIYCKWRQRTLNVQWSIRNHNKTQESAKGRHKFCSALCDINTLKSASAWLMLTHVHPENTECNGHYVSSYFQV